MFSLVAVSASTAAPQEPAAPADVPDRCWIPTFTGRAFDVVAPASRDVSIRDIAHSLSLQCRFGGHCQRFYSLAEHSVLLSRLVDAKLALCALLHEAAHAYVQEVIVPVRALLPGYRELADGIWDVVARRFRLPAMLPQPVRHADRRLLATEIEYLLLPTSRPWPRDLEPLSLEALGLRSSKQLGLLPREARQQFLERFAELAV